MHGFGPKFVIFACFYFRHFRPGKCVSRYSRTKKNFYAVKTRSFKSLKIEIFPKGLVHGFGRKLAIFARFYFRQYSPGKCVLRYSKRKRRLSRL